MIARVYHDAAAAMGRLIGECGHTLVWGGSNAGTMTTVAESARRAGARLIGVIPKAFADRGIAYPHAHEMHVTAGMRERKALMDQKADAFVVLAGGIGTMEEFIEMLTLKQLNYHQRPIIVVNTAGFYDPLLAFMDRMMADRFMRPETRQYFDVVQQPHDAMHAILNYSAPEIVSKWSTG
jgi:uncharacterized protein (TIGR00730 family)